MSEAAPTQDDEEHILGGVNVMEASDMKKLRQPIRATWKYVRVDGVWILHAQKNKIGTIP